MSALAGISLRAADPADAAALGALHVASWRETYADLLPGAMLEELSIEARSAMWGAVLNDPGGHGATTVFVAEEEGEIVGFAACGSQRDEALRGRGFHGEIGAVYVLKSHQRAGVGRSLMTRAAQSLLDRWHAAATLWVLCDNANARLFYERLGGTAVGERTDEQANTVLTEIAYGWSDLAHLVGDTPRPVEL